MAQVARVVRRQFRQQDEPGEPDPPAQQAMPDRARREDSDAGSGKRNTMGRIAALPPAAKSAGFVPPTISSGPDAKKGMEPVHALLFVCVSAGDQAGSVSAS
jgi:hypothetical protein